MTRPPWATPSHKRPSSLDILSGRLTEGWIILAYTVAPRYNEGRRDWQKFVHYNEVSLYRGSTLSQKRNMYLCLITGQHTRVTEWQSSWPRCQPSARCWGQTSQWTAGFDSASYSVCTRTQPTMWWIQKSKSSGTVFSPSLRRVKGNVCLHWTTNRIVVIPL